MSKCLGMGDQQLIWLLYCWQVDELNAYGFAELWAHKAQTREFFVNGFERIDVLWVMGVSFILF